MSASAGAAARRTRRADIRPKPRNDRGLIIETVDGHTVLRFDTRRAQLAALITAHGRPDALAAWHGARRPMPARWGL